MKQTIGLDEFRTAFHRMGRGDNFSYEGLEEIYNYYEENYPDFEMDVIGICCEWTEHDSKEELLKYYDANSIRDVEYIHIVIKTSIDSYLVLE